MDGTAQSGLRAVSFNANDLESGVASVAILLGKTVVGTADFAAECSYADLAACPRARRGAVSADTRKVADGIYPVSLRIRDAAGNEQTVASPTAIEVANGAAPTQGQASPASAHLTASFAKSRGATLTVNYGRRARIRGRLTGSANEPLGGAVLEASERSLGRAGPARSASVTTAADGTFTYITAAGTSRTIRLAYPSGGTSSELRLRVKASATLAVRLHGITVRYSGRVKSTPLPRDGKLVEVQGRAPGAGWKTFAKRRTSRRGKYSGTYRLRIHRPGVRLQFRVRVPTEPGYPFVAHAGRALDRIVQ